MLTTKKKQAVIAKHRKHEKDTGSSEVQVAVLTEQIKSLASHLKKHKKDMSSRRGLLKMVAERRSLMKYLSKHDAKKHKELAKQLDLRK